MPISVSGKPKTFDVSAAFGAMRSDYAAAKETQYMRGRTGIALGGSGEDYHFRNEAEFFKILEYARDFDRNDMHVSAFVDRVKTNTLQGGFTLDPQTGDKQLNNVLWQLWDDWANDPQRCDASGRNTFAELIEQVFRSRIVDGEMFALLTDDGVQLVESHRCKNPGGGENVVLGIELNERRKPIRYHFSEDVLEARVAGYIAGPTVPIDAFDERGRPQVLHVLTRRRPSQTRGVSAFAPIFSTLDKIEDITFAKMLQQQIVSCFAILRERALKSDGNGYPEPTPLGPQEVVQTGASTGATTETLEGVAPGMIVTGQPGEKLTGFSPNVPNAEFFQHYESMLTIVSINLGLPLMLALLRPDGSYSAYRGAIDQARFGFRANQQALLRTFSKPVYRWLLDRWADETPALADARRRLGEAYYRHRWNLPAFPYIEPVADAQSDLMRLANGLISPRRLHAERGRDWDDVVVETIADLSYAIRRAKKAAAKINSRFDDGMPVHWRELMPLPTATGQSISLVPPVAAGPVTDNTTQQPQGAPL